MSALTVPPAITGSLMVNEVVKIVSETGSVLYNRLWITNSFTNQHETKPFSPVPESVALASFRSRYQGQGEAVPQPVF